MMPIRHARPIIAILLILLPAMGSQARTATPSPAATPSTPISSPVITPDTPSGALGAQILWIADAINFPAIDGTPDRIALHISPSFLALVPIETLTDDFATIRTELGIVTMQDVTIASKDYPPSVARFTLVGTNGGAIHVSIAVDPTSRLIDHLYFSLDSGMATPTQTRQILGAVLPEGPLGTQMEWLLGVLNDPAADLADDVLATHFSASMLKNTGADALRSRIDAARQAAPLIIANSLISTTMNIPPTTGTCTLQGRGGESFRLVVTIAPRDGLIDSLVLTPMPD